MPTGINNAIAQAQGVQLLTRSISLTIGFEDNTQDPITGTFNADAQTGRDISGFDMEFVVEKSLKSTEPNTLQLQVYNFATTTRNAICSSPKLTVKLEAGYAGGVTQLYFAETRAAWNTRSGPDYITHIESTDTIARPTGVRATKKIQPGSIVGTLYKTLGPKVPLADAFNAITQQLGIGNGNLQAALANLHGASVSAVNGAALTGNGAQRMTDLCRSAGLEWSIQDGQLQLLNIGQALATTSAILVSDDTGMIDSPSVDSSGILSCKTLLIPGLLPGVLVTVNSVFLNGTYRVNKCRYSGTTFGNDWTCAFTGDKY